MTAHLQWPGTDRGVLLYSPCEVGAHGLCLCCQHWVTQEPVLQSLHFANQVDLLLDQIASKSVPVTFSTSEDQSVVFDDERSGQLPTLLPGQRTRYTDRPHEIVCGGVASPCLTTPSATLGTHLASICMMDQHQPLQGFQMLVHQRWLNQCKSLSAL